MEDEGSSSHHHHHHRRRLILRLNDHHDDLCNSIRKRHFSQSHSDHHNHQVNTSPTTLIMTNPIPQSDLDLDKSTYDISYLPDTLLLEFIVRLPVKSIFRFKCVSKHWLSLISHPSFSRSFLSLRRNDTSQSFRILYRYVYVSTFTAVINRLRPDIYNSLDFSVLFLSTFEEQQQSDQFKILGSSHGLILICLLGPFIYYVCDPITRKWVALPRGRSNGTHRHPVFFGESIVCKVNQDNVVTSFKVVRVEWVDSESQYLNLEIYSSETGEWTDHRLLCSQPIQLLKRGCGPIHFNGSLHWFVHDHGMVAFNPYKDTSHCRIINFPEDRDVDSEYTHDGLYRLCDECQGELRFFEVAPEDSDFYCFSMWVMKEYEKGEWILKFRVTRSDLWSDDPELSGCLMSGTFVPLTFHPFDLDVVYLRCVELSCIVAYNIGNKRIDLSCKPIGVVEELSWRVVIPFVLPIWPTPVPLAPEKAAAEQKQEEEEVTSPGVKLLRFI